MSADEVFGAVRDTIAYVLDMEPSAVDMEAGLNSLGLDEMTAVEVAMDLEDGMGLRIPESDIDKAQTGRGLAEYVHSRIKK